jgi:hypothetical protein
MGGGSEGTFHEVARPLPMSWKVRSPLPLLPFACRQGRSCFSGKSRVGGQARGAQPAGGGLLFHCIACHGPGVWQTWTSATLLHQTYNSPVGVQLHRSTASHQLHRHRQKHESAESPVSPSPTSDPTLPFIPMLDARYARHHPTSYPGTARVPPQAESQDSWEICPGGTLLGHHPHLHGTRH